MRLRPPDSVTAFPRSLRSFAQRPVEAYHHNGSYMTGNRWEPDEDAYSRVTNPERFGVLHAVAIELLNRLVTDFDVERKEGYGIDPELENPSEQLARPTIMLAPGDIRAAPVVVAFSAFPGILVRCGLWCKAIFPLCGCDACASFEKPESEAERFRSMVDDVTNGRFRERVHRSTKSTAELIASWELWSDSGRVESSMTLDSDRAREPTHSGLTGHGIQLQSFRSSSAIHSYT